MCDSTSVVDETAKVESNELSLWERAAGAEAKKARKRLEREEEACDVPFVCVLRFHPPATAAWS